MQLKSAILSLLTCICVQHIQAQHAAHKTKNGWANNTQFVQTDSGLLIINYTKSACKTTDAESGLVQNLIEVAMVRVPIKTIEPTKPKFLIIHGNVSYDYFYRSKIDTPFNQENLQQHTERVWLDVLVKEKYPFKVGFTARQSNSPFFRDLYNMNLNFDRNNYTKGLKQELLNNLTKYEWDNPYLKMIDTALKFELAKYQLLQQSYNAPAALQKLIESKEAIYFAKQRAQKLPQIPNLLDSLNLPQDSLKLISGYKMNKGKFDNFFRKQDSTLLSKQEVVKQKEAYADSVLENSMKATKQKMDSLNNYITKLKKQSDSIKHTIAQNTNKIKKLIYAAKDSKELEKIALENGISKQKKERLQNFLGDVKKLGIGRSMVDYTELTAQNVMLTGINIEYNPSYYVAVAAGKIDFGFRDFLGRENRQKNQYLTLARVGWGNRDKRSVILTVFNGKKSNYNAVATGNIGDNSSKLYGYSIETIIKKNEYTSFSVEVAKSTKYDNQVSNADSSKSENLFNYSDKSNLGINIKAQTIIPQTNTLLSGFYRSTGNQFQSFSLFTYNTNQKAWQIRAEQSFLKRKINITAMLRQNDFTNPLATQNFKTTTVFKTFQLNVKVPRWPILNAGYYPGSQFYLVDNNTIRENVYYILNGSLLYPYSVKDINMSSSVMYNRFFNQSTDSGFVFYKGINYTINQSVLLKKLQLQGSYAFNQQAVINFYTLDANGDYAFKKILKIGAGVKYNHVQGGANYWGESIRLGADLKMLGNLQLSYEKSYLPTVQQTLSQVEIGRVSWYKFF
jgi:hypothetical protein